MLLTVHLPGDAASPDVQLVSEVSVPSSSWLLMRSQRVVPSLAKRLLNPLALHCCSVKRPT